MFFCDFIREINRIYLTLTVLLKSYLLNCKSINNRRFFCYIPQCDLIGCGAFSHLAFSIE